MALIDITWHNAKEQFPGSTESLRRADPEDSEAEIAFRTDLFVEDGVILWTEDRLVGGPSLFWKPGKGWFDGEPDHEGDLIIS